jgi:hypothetical protein
MTELRERFQIDKMKVSIKGKLLEYRTYYLSEFKCKWTHIPDAAIGLAVEELEREGFLTVRAGKKNAVLLALKEA